MCIVKYWGTFAVYLCTNSEYFYCMFPLDQGWDSISKQDSIPLLMQLKSQGEQRQTDNKYLINTTVKKKGRESVPRVVACGGKRGIYKKVIVKEGLIYKG